MSRTLIYNDFSKPISVAQIGGKAYNLRHLSTHGFPVPKWFCLTTDFFREFLGDKLASYDDLIRNYSEKNRQKIVDLIQKQEFSLDLEKAVLRQLQDFSVLAVRSSATDEDGSNFSFAGMMDSFLNVSHGDVFDYIKRCFISVFSVRAMEYRLQNSLLSSHLAPAVIIMEMVTAGAAGVIFTTNPRTNNPDEVLISVVKGLGDKLVSGDRDSQDYVLNLENQIVKQPERPILNHASLIKIADLARAAEGSYPERHALDLEFAIQNENVYLLQARPIATYARIDKNLPRTILDNSNIIESYSGVTTPLTFSFAQEVYGKIYHQTLRNFGIKESLISRLDNELNHMLYFYQNKVYYNLGNWYQMTALYPGYSKNKKYMENMMGVKVSLHEPRIFQNTRAARIYLRFIRKMLSIKRDSERFLQKFHKVTDPLLGKDFIGKSNEELMQIYNDLEHEILDDFTTPIANDMGAMVFYGLLTDRIKHANIKQGDGLISDILSQQGDMESLKPTDELLKIVKTIQHDPKLELYFKTTDTKTLVRELRKGSLPILQQFNDYIAKYGARSMEELKLETITMVQDPSFLFQTIKQYLNKSSNISTKKKQIDANKKLLDNYKGPNKLYIRLLLDITKFFVRNRELLRMQRTYIYDIARSIFLAFGRNFSAAKIIKNYRDIFFLEKTEIFEIARMEYKLIDSNYWQKLISERKEEYEKNKIRLTYERMYFYGTITEENMLPVYSEQEVSENANILRGVAGGGAPKVGIVQYITDPNQPLREGAILMAKRTDPGWVVLFPLAQAIIVERGSILSHSAVVAREMGKTLVIGVRGLTEQVHDGDKVRVDGVNGTVEVLHE